MITIHRMIRHRLIFFFLSFWLREISTWKTRFAHNVCNNFPFPHCKTEMNGRPWIFHANVTSRSTFASHLPLMKQLAVNKYANCHSDSVPISSKRGLHKTIISAFRRLAQLSDSEVCERFIYEFLRILVSSIKTPARHYCFSKAARQRCNFYFPILHRYSAKNGKLKFFIDNN